MNDVATLAGVLVAVAIVVLFYRAAQTWAREEAERKQKAERQRAEFEARMNAPGDGSIS